MASTSVSEWCIRTLQRIISDYDDGRALQQLLAFREDVAAEVLHEGGNSNHRSTAVDLMREALSIVLSDFDQNKMQSQTTHHQLMKLQQEDQDPVSLLTNYYKAD